MKKILLPCIVAFLIGSAIMQSCEKDNLDTQTTESELPKNPLFGQVRLLHSTYVKRPNSILITEAIDSFLYDQNNRVSYYYNYVERRNCKYYEDKIDIYYVPYGESGIGQLIFTYLLNDNYFPIERKNITSDWELGPDIIKYGYNGSTVKYEVWVYNNPNHTIYNDSTVYIYNNGNITESRTYRNNVLNTTDYYEYDNKINPYYGFIIPQHDGTLAREISVYNRNNIVKHTIDWADFYTNSVYEWTYTYNNENLPFSRLFNSDTTFFTYN